MGDECASARIAQRIVVLEIDAQVRRHRLEIMPFKPRKCPPRHCDRAGKPKGKRRAKCAFDLHAVELRVVRDEQRGRPVVAHLGEQPRLARLLDRILDEAMDVAPSLAELRLALDHRWRDAVNIDEARVEPGAGVDIPMLFAQDLATQYDGNTD